MPPTKPPRSPKYNEVQGDAPASTEKRQDKQAELKIQPKMKAEIQYQKDRKDQRPALQKNISQFNNFQSLDESPIEKNKKSNGFYDDATKATFSDSLDALLPSSSSETTDVKQQKTDLYRIKNNMIKFEKNLTILSLYF